MMSTFKRITAMHNQFTQYNVNVLENIMFTYSGQTTAT